MTSFVDMAARVRAQAETFLSEQGVASDAPLPEMDEQRTIGDMLAAPLPEDRVTAALAILRTVDALSACRMSWLTSHNADGIEMYAALAYRLRMYQDAMHSEKLRTRYKKHHASKPRQSGADREGSAAWLLAEITTDKRPLEDMLRIIAEGQKQSGPVVVNDINLELLDEDGKRLSGRRVTGKCDISYIFGDASKKVSVKRLRNLAQT